MSGENRWSLPEDGKDLLPVFAAAKKKSPQLVFDQDGVFTVSYSEAGKKGSAQDFLTRGGPDDR
jgi:hypothetical protein